MKNGHKIYKTLMVVLLALMPTLVMAQHSVSLTWTPPTTSTGITGYNVYKGVKSGGPYTKLTPAPVSTTAYTDSAVTANTTYYYVATSLSSGGESVNSSEVSAAIPQGTTPVTLTPPSNPATFSPAAGTRVGQVAANNVRATPALGGTLYGSAPTGALGYGTVTSTPTVNSNQGWIYVQIKYDSCSWSISSTFTAAGCVGWTGGDELGTLSGGVTPPPPPPPLAGTPSCTTTSAIPTCSISGMVSKQAVTVTVTDPASGKVLGSTSASKP